MDFTFEKRNNTLLIEWLGKDNFRGIAHIKYHPDTEYPLCSELITDIKDTDKPVVFHNAISHEDYKFICDQFKVPIERGFGAYKVWVAICLYNEEESTANNAIRVFLDCTKDQMLASHHLLLRKKLKEDKKKEIEISFCVNYGVRRRIKIMIEEEDELNTKTDEELFELFKESFDVKLKEKIIYEFNMPDSD